MSGRPDMSRPGSVPSRVLLAGHGGDKFVSALARRYIEAGSRVVLVGAGDVTPGVELLPPPEETPGGIGGVVEQATEHLGGLDAFIRFSQPSSSAPVLEADPENWQQQLSLVIGGALVWSQQVARAMSSGGGSIVHVATLDAFHAYPDRSCWAAAMSGLIGLTRALGIELATAGVRANVVIRGPLAPAHAGPNALLERALLRSPMGRLADPAEIAAAVIFVSSERAAFMTGQTLRVDGGWASLNQAPAGMRFP